MIGEEISERYLKFSTRPSASRRILDKAMLPGWLYLRLFKKKRRCCCTVLGPSELETLPDVNHVAKVDESKTGRLIIHC